MLDPGLISGSSKPSPHPMQALAGSFHRLKQRSQQPLRHRTSTGLSFSKQRWHLSGKHSQHTPLENSSSHFQRPLLRLPHTLPFWSLLQHRLHVFDDDHLRSKCRKALSQLEHQLEHPLFELGAGEAPGSPTGWATSADPVNSADADDGRIASSDTEGGIPILREITTRPRKGADGLEQTETKQRAGSRAGTCATAVV